MVPDKGRKLVHWFSIILNKYGLRAKSCRPYRKLAHESLCNGTLLSNFMNPVFFTACDLVNCILQPIDFIKMSCAIIITTFFLAFFKQVLTT